MRLEAYRPVLALSLCVGLLLPMAAIAESAQETEKPNPLVQIINNPPQEKKEEKPISTPAPLNAKPDTDIETQNIFSSHLVVNTLNKLSMQIGEEVVDKLTNETNPQVVIISGFPALQKNQQDIAKLLQAFHAMENDATSSEMKNHLNELATYRQQLDEFLSAVEPALQDEIEKCNKNQGMKHGVMNTGIPSAELPAVEAPKTLQRIGVSMEPLSATINFASQVLDFIDKATNYQNVVKYGALDIPPDFLAASVIGGATHYTQYRQEHTRQGKEPCKESGQENKNNSIRFFDATNRTVLFNDTLENIEPIYGKVEVVLKEWGQKLEDLRDPAAKLDALNKDAAKLIKENPSCTGLKNKAAKIDNKNTELETLLKEEEKKYNETTSKFRELRQNYLSLVANSIVLDVQPWLLSIKPLYAKLAYDDKRTLFGRIIGNTRWYTGGLAIQYQLMKQTGETVAAGVSNDLTGYVQARYRRRGIVPTVVWGSLNETFHIGKDNNPFGQSVKFWPHRPREFQWEEMPKNQYEGLRP